LSGRSRALLDDTSEHGIGGWPQIDARLEAAAFHRHVIPCVGALLSALGHCKVARDAHCKAHERVGFSIRLKAWRHLPDTQERLLQNRLCVDEDGERTQARADGRLGAREPASERLRVARGNRGDEYVEVDR
jgi:hypothetical protein